MRTKSRLPVYKKEYNKDQLHFSFTTGNTMSWRYTVFLFYFF